MVIYAGDITYKSFRNRIVDQTYYNNVLSNTVNIEITSDYIEQIYNYDSKLEQRKEKIKKIISRIK